MTILGNVFHKLKTELATPLTAAKVLDTKLQSLLQNLTYNITREMGKIAQKLRGEMY